MGEVIYQYDGSLEGFLCCVYECYAYKEQPASFCCEDDPLSLYEVRTVVTREDRSRRVRLGISGRSEKAMTLVRRGFLTCMEDKELRLTLSAGAIHEHPISVTVGEGCGREA